ncbi:MAG: 7-cyano-7-deazaguanine synthase QueC [Planctomycetes bacterium]|nr:7-cyano-7-deazaguanine synthase QueC [Planctomycetota bacterium]
MNATPAIVLVSGGLDSATVLAMAKADGYLPHALTFDYGQRHDVELQAANTVCESLGVALPKVIQLDLRAIGGSALTADIDVPKDRPDGAEGIPITYVPARNTLFLSYALAYAEAAGAHDIFIGVNAVDYSGYPDCRPEFIEAFETLANLATREGVEGRPIRIHAPLVKLTKAEIIRRGVALGVDYGLTHSCYDPVGGLACGRCDSCTLRRRGFIDAGINDPTRYTDSA